MRYDEISGFRGLYLQPNTFELPKGSLEIAENVNIEDRDTVTKCRGYYKYYDYSIDDQEILNITSYDNKIVAVLSTSMAYFDDTGVAPNITGTLNAIPQDSSVSISYSGVDNPTFVQSNGNLYTTTNQGVVKLSSATSTLYQSGAPQGLDLTGGFNIGTSATWWDISSDRPDSKTVGYRVLFGYEDGNNNLIIGAPSSIWTISNPVVTVPEPNVSVSGAGPYTLTVTSPSHGLSGGENLQFFDANTFTSPENTEGYYTITVNSADEFEYEVANNPGVASGGISYALAMQPRVEFSVPTQITSTDPGWFYQIFRSDQQISTVGVQSDFKLIDQRTLTAQEITDSVVFYNDNKSELFKGELLYTNQNSGEGELQSNFRAPQCQTMDLFQNYMFYGNCKSRHLLDMAVIDPTVLSTSSYLEVNVGNNYRRYFVADGPGNSLVRSETVTAGLVTYTGHGIPVTTLSTIYITNADGGLADGLYYANATGANSFQFATSLANWISGTWVTTGAITSLDFESVWQCRPVPAGNPFAWSRTGSQVTITSTAHGLNVGMQVYISNSTVSNAIATGIYTITSVPTVDSFVFSEGTVSDTGTADYQELTYVFYDNNLTESPSEQIRDSAENLVKAINRDPLSDIYAQYVSSPIDAPGNIRLQSKGFGDPIYLVVDSTTTQGAFFPVIPDSFSDPNQFGSTDETKINSLYFSKLSEPEAVPLVNFISVGSSKSEILAIHALASSLVIIKSDGVFRLSGDNPSNFIASLLDGTVRGVARRSSNTFSNQVSLLSNQGICLVSETSVQILSRPIENVIQTIVQEPTIDVDTAAVSYEIERQYLISTVDPEGEKVMYAYNVLTDAWTTWTWTFSAAAVGPDRKMYMVSNDRKSITRERKDNQKTDYSGQNYPITVVDDSNPKVILIQSNSYDPKYGDAIIKEGVINVISDVSLSSPNNFNVTLFYPSNLTNGDSLQIYSSYDSTVKLAPYTSGQVGLQKQFGQIQAHFRNQSCTSLDISFTTGSYDDSDVINWQERQSVEGWGTFKWGLDSWGQAVTSSLDYSTTSSAIARVYTSRQAQRSTFFQPKIINRVSGDRINLQSINVAVRNYGERVTR